MKKLVSALGFAALSLATSMAAAAPVQWSSNGHWYEFVSGNFTWQQALADAATRSFGGQTGYLATLTSAEENRFASISVAQGALAWISGTDEAVEGVWRWAAGPEAGQELTFFSWNGGEPNNCCGGENYLHTNWGSPGMWNDHGGPGNPGQLNGYLVEFAGSAVPEPASVALVLAALGAAGGLRRRRR